MIRVLGRLGLTQLGLKASDFLSLGLHLSVESIRLVHRLADMRLVAELFGQLVAAQDHSLLAEVILALGLLRELDLADHLIERRAH